MGITRTGRIVVREELTQELIEGNVFTATALKTISGSGTFDVTIETPAAPTILAIQDATITVAAKATVQFREAVTATGGSTITAEDANRILDTASNATIIQDPTVTDTGDLLAQSLVPGGEKDKDFGAAISGDRGWILAASTKYLVRVTDTSAGSNDSSIAFSLVEV